MERVERPSREGGPGAVTQCADSWLFVATNLYCLMGRRVTRSGHWFKPSVKAGSVARLLGR